MGNVIFILQIKKSGWRRPNGDVAVINALSSKLMLFSIHPTWFNLLILFHEMKQLWKQIEGSFSGKVKVSLQSHGPQIFC